jgi:hypothetical protein
VASWPKPPGSGHLQPPAYVLIALVIALVALLLLLAGVLFAPD